MQILVLYLVSAAIFLIADAIALKLLIRPVFEHHVGEWLRESILYGPAIIFYLLYVAALTWLVSLPAYAGGSPGIALLNGAIFGAAAYGTYEFTNYATLSRWSLAQVAIDGIWGTVLTAFAAWAGVAIVQGMG